MIAYQKWWPRPRRNLGGRCEITESRSGSFGRCISPSKSARFSASTDQSPGLDNLIGRRPLEELGITKLIAQMKNQIDVQMFIRRTIRWEEHRIEK